MPIATIDLHQSAEEQERRIGAFYELMPNRVSDILLISSLYDYCIMEEDGRLAERIIYEYRGLNLTRPPRITWVPSPQAALETLARKTFQLVITMPRMTETDSAAMAAMIKSRYPGLSIFKLTHRAPPPRGDSAGHGPGDDIDRTFVWSGNTDLLVAQIKLVEDQWNAAHDTQAAGVRIIMLIEDSPAELSALLPILYREVVIQTQAAMEEGLNEEHRILTMRSRAKVLVAETYEDAMETFRRYHPFLLGVISDVRFARRNRLDDAAGVDLLGFIKNKIPDLPMLLTSSEPRNRSAADAIGAVFLDKNSPALRTEIRSFLRENLGFGDFVFRTPEGREIARASNRLALERILEHIPLDSFSFHANRNDFSRWLFARAEIFLAQRLRPVTGLDFKGDMEKMRSKLHSSMAFQRKWQQKGMVVDFNTADADLGFEFAKIGRGSLGGKARGLAFIARLLKENHSLYRKYPQVNMIIPQTLVITTDVFDAVVSGTGLAAYAEDEEPDLEIARRFMVVRLPSGIVAQLETFLAKVRYPLSVRSSGLLEDARFQAYAGLYHTYMLPNDHPDPDERMRQLLAAIRLIFASTYFSGPKAFARRIGQRTEEEKMAVIIQKLIGNPHGEFFYPTLSGVAQSLNYYPFGRMQPEDGCATIALGLGKTVVEGRGALRFSPREPQVLPHFSGVDDILQNAQRSFYALRLGGGRIPAAGSDDPNLILRQIADARDEPPVQYAAATYIPEENRIRDSGFGPGRRIITFPQILKDHSLPLTAMLTDILSVAEEGMGAPVELEFALDPLTKNHHKPCLAILQARPMAGGGRAEAATVTAEDIRRAFCYSHRALGNTIRQDFADVVYVKPAAFNPAYTAQMAAAIGRCNAGLVAENRTYLLIGPGRWGSADPWLGVPVNWQDISAVGAIVETSFHEIQAEPSQGSHFFHNITTLGIAYFTIATATDFIDWNRLTALPVIRDEEFIVHARFPAPFLLKVDGRSSQGVIIVR